MSEYLPFLVAGIVAGSVYGLTAMGLVLSYKTTGIFNFAYGAVGTASAYLFFELWQRDGLAWPLAGVITLVAVAAIGGPVMELIGRALVRVSVATRVVATIGLLLGIQGICIAVFGAASIAFPPFLPTDAVHVLGANVGVDQIIITLFTAAVAGALFLFFRSSRLGLSMQAVVDNPDLLGLLGTSQVRVRLASWLIGFSFAAVSGVLLGPTIDLDAPLLTLLVVEAFGAAAIGRFSSLPWTYAGGLMIGIAEALIRKVAPQHEILRGFPPSIPFIVLFVVLVLSGRRRLTEWAARSRPLLSHRPLPRPALFGGPPVVLAAAVAVPWIVGTRLPVYSEGLVFVVLFVSLALLVRTSGQVSLCHAAFAAVGASSFSHFAHGAGLPWLLALFLAGLVAVPVGAIVAIPAIRLSGIYLALATFGFGILLEDWVYRRDIMFGRLGPVVEPRPSWFESDRAFYYVLLAVAVGACVLVAVVRRSRLGRLLRALSDSPVALTAQGVNTQVTLVIVFCISAFLAGIAGALLGALSGFIDPSPFDAFQSLLYLAVLAIAGAGELRASVVASLLIAVVPVYLAGSDTIATYEPVAFGIGAVAVALAESGLVGGGQTIRRAAARALGRTKHGPTRERVLVLQEAR